ncbi:hypothetical protein MIC97_00915 [Aquamicrobium sp. NLF2-7]|uniref:hypothetical protein n=1 Tax=Aquamicrobium sp. NLF2-7 TaxID=2918753 RepID=UPI001EFABE7C|nr:hypothetical protein [Aquamicrobium sp. NLF2-7]MCG8270076.1 hypothetical protein [Aquamicrobium sp. NLF2-7]
MDFASLLDDLFAPPREEEPAAPLPSIPFDYLAVVEELHSGRIRVSDEALAARYLESETDTGLDFSVLLDQARAALAGETPSQREELPSIDPDCIASELGLGEPAVNLREVRRRFALSNHPDRMPPHLRHRAMIRMQIANMLIDEAGLKKKRR